MELLWEITHEKVQTVINKIVDISRPKKLIIFGSYIKNNLHKNSDLDILVITEKELISPRKESVRIRHALKGIIMSMDILVVSENKLLELADQPGLIYKQALEHGKIVYESNK